MKYDVDPIQIFENELSLIENNLIREVVEKTLLNVPDYFFFVPASSSGKYHPKSSLGMHGLVRHTKAVFYISEELLNHPLIGMSSYIKDIARGAIILHDTAKQGTSNTGEGRTRIDHPLLVKEYSPIGQNEHGYKLGERMLLQSEVAKVQNIWIDIVEAMETHMGPWTTDRDGKDILPKPDTPVQTHVHMCDYLASRKSIEVDIWDRKPQKFEPATQKQVEYVRALFAEAVTQGKDVDKYKTTLGYNGGQALSKSEASRIIGELKELRD